LKRERTSRSFKLAIYEFIDFAAEAFLRMQKLEHAHTASQNYRKRYFRRLISNIGDLTPDDSIFESLRDMAYACFFWTHSGTNWRISQTDVTSIKPCRSRKFAKI
jgi:hypothetical protein